MLGAFILWFGWYGFNAGETACIANKLTTLTQLVNTICFLNAGSALSITGPDQSKIISLAAVNTTLAAASSCSSALGASYVIAERRTGEGEFNLKSAMNGCLAGLVAITGGCACEFYSASNRTANDRYSYFIIPLLLPS
jgi:Amt family ammonium transporter